MPEPERESSVASRRVAVGRRIRGLREESGVSQATIAEAAGLSRPFYGAIENGRRNVSLDNLFAIADALGVDVGAFFRNP